MTDASLAAVKIVLERRVRPGAHRSFEKWLQALLAQAATFPGLQGSSVLSARDDYFIMLRFGNQADLERWQRSPEVLDLLAAAAPLLTSGEAGHVRTGLETWFTLPGQRPPAVAPPRWKMALVTWCALSPQVIALLVVMPSWVPLPVAAVVSTAVAVALLTWVVMPRLARLLHRWLHGERAQQ